MSVIKIFIAALLIGVILYLSYSEFATPPLSVKQVINEGVQQAKANQHLSPSEEALLRLQLALGEYIAANSSPPNSLEDLVPKYFDTLPIDPVAGEPFAYRKNGTSFYLGKQVELTSAGKEANRAEAAVPGAAQKPAEEFINPNTMQIANFVYDALGKRDPFQSFDQRQKQKVDESLPPLERYAVGQLKATAIASDEDGVWTAMVEDVTGRGYPVRVGTRVGNAGGVIESIEKDKINIVETNIDFTGKEEKRVVVMKLAPKSESFQTAKGAKRVKPHKKK